MQVELVIWYLLTSFLLKQRLIIFAVISHYFKFSQRFFSMKHQINESLLMNLKHLRQFVQSDWFLPVFISHNKDTALNVCTTHARGWIDPLECRDLFLSWSDSSVIIHHFWSHFTYFKFKMFKNENKGIVFMFLKRVWFVRPDTTRTYDH